MRVTGYDFSGWATRNDVLCADGRTIRRDAFKDNDGAKVPLVWNHKHGDVLNVLGHGILENRPEGVYMYGFFNDTPNGKHAKEAVKNGDVDSLSIFANRLQQVGGDVLHGMIREVSLVLAGANPIATIDTVMAHSDDEGESANIRFNSLIEIGEISHAEDEEEKPEEDKEKKEMANNNEKTVQEVFDTLTEEQKTVVYALIGQAIEDNESKGDNEEMKHNVFESDYEVEQNVLSHADIMEMIDDAKRFGSLRDSVLAHAETYGIDNIEYLFPEAKNFTEKPEFIKRDTDWVAKVMNGIHKSPFSRVKSIFADITEDEARAKGYIKGKLKKEEVFSLLKRTTTPTTIYKKQKLDRDDIVDITDFDVIAWIKQEMRIMLDEEIARAILIGDGRLNSDDDKINESCIRPIVNDADLFTIRWAVAAGSSDDDKAKNFIRAAIKSRKNYKGSGNPTLFTTEDMLTDMLLLEDGIGHKLYKTEAELATALRVKEIITVPVMENFTDKDSKAVYGIIVNLADYNAGADKGGAVNMFDDFDIDYNQQKYLMETRCSGALIKPFSAIVLRAGSSTATEEPSLDDAKESIG